MKNKIVALFLAAILVFPNVALARTYHVPIIMYHKVVDICPSTSKKDYAFYITPKLFEAEMRYLRNHGYKTIFMKDAAAAIAAGKNISGNSVVLTFDDGTSDFPETVLPVLKKYNLHATIYVNPGFNGKNDRMTWEDIMALGHSDLVEVAAHTMDHVNLTTVSLDEARSQIEDSKTVIEHLIDKPVVSFAYPFGGHNADLANMVQSLGFTSGVISEQIGEESSSTQFILPRLRIGDTNHIETFIKLLRG